MQGTLDDAQTVTVNGSAALVRLAAKTFASPRAAVEGRNEIVATGIDKAGNAGSATLVVTSTRARPISSSPRRPANACLNVQTITVAGISPIFMRTT